ncbi:MAG: hypothetical protein PHC75_07380 [Burkholderiales bacterium]|nr:hypothetical protein [Burkholderiales bacterium]
MAKPQKILLISSIALTFMTTISCSSGTGSTSNSTSYGQLYSYGESASYTLPQIKKSAYDTICFGLESTSIECQSNLTNLQNSYGFSINSIENNSSGATGVSAYNITYNSQGLTTDGKFNYTDRVVSGAVYIPKDVSINNIKGIILYYHPTAYNSNDYSHEMDAINGVKFPSLYAINGYIVVMPDLLGFGADNTEMHPYIYPNVNVIAGINMLKATNILLGKLSKAYSDKPLLINGFSEGGMLSQKASYMIQDNQVSLDGTNTHLAFTVPMSGGFAMKSVQTPMEYSNLNIANNEFLIESQLEAAMAKPGLIAYATNAFNYYNSGTDCSEILSNDFCNLTYAGRSITINQLFMDKDISTAAIQDTLWEHAQSISDYSYESNSIYSITQNPVLDAFRKAYYDVSLINWKTTSPISYIHLAHDSLLSPYNTMLAFSSVTERSDPNLVRKYEIQNSDYVLGSNHAPIDHNNPIMYIAALSLFNEFMSNM